MYKALRWTIAPQIAAIHANVLNMWRSYVCFMEQYQWHSPECVKIDHMDLWYNYVILILSAQFKHENEETEIRYYLILVRVLLVKVVV